MLIEPLFEAFREKTGIKVQYVFAKKGLTERLAQEGRSSPADILLTADAGRLVDASARGLTQSVDDASIQKNVPSSLRDPGNHWFGLTMRARVLYASRDRVKQDTFTYDELADPKWKGKVCIRSGQHPYNIGMFAAMIAHKGAAATKDWLAGVKANLARRPTGNERAQAKAILSGECDLAIAQHLLHGQDADQREGSRAEGLGSSEPHRVSNLARRQDACEHFRHGNDQACSQPGKRTQADDVPVITGGPGDLCAGQFRIPGEPRRSRHPSWFDPGAAFTPDDLAIGKLHEFQKRRQHAG